MKEEPIEYWVDYGKSKSKLIVFHGTSVLDLTDFAKFHPGSEEAIRTYKFMNVESVLFKVYPHSPQTKKKLLKFQIGILKKPKEKKKVVDKKKEETKVIEKGNLKEEKKVTFFGKSELLEHSNKQNLKLKKTTSDKSAEKSLEKQTVKKSSRSKQKNPKIEQKKEVVKFDDDNDANSFDEGKPELQIPNMKIKLKFLNEMIKDPSLESSMTEI